VIAIEASVEIDRSPQDVWDYVVRFDDWWPAANPDEHIELSVMDNREIEKGTKLVLKERIAGIRGEATVEILAFQPPKRLEWKSLSAKYMLLGMGIKVKEGGTFTISPTDTGCVLRHRVWRKPDYGFMSAVAEWFFKCVLKGELRDFEHTQRELLFIKRRLESRSA